MSLNQGIIKYPPKSFESLDAQCSLEFLEKRVKHYEDLRKFGYCLQLRHKSQIFQKSEQVENIVAKIRGSQELLQTVRSIVIKGAMSLVAVEVVLGSLVGIKWLINHWKERKQNGRDGKIELSPVLRMHARDLRLE